MAVAAKSSKCTALVTALKAADLVTPRQDPGPFTVFAPTDTAFAKLPKGTLEDLLKPENKAKPTGILTDHAVPGKVKTVNGAEIDIKVKNGHVTLQGAKVIKMDTAASNGVILSIDTVLIPE